MSLIFLFILRSANLDPRIQMQRLLYDLIGGEAERDHRYGPQVVDGEAPVEALADPVLLVHVDQGGNGAGTGNEREDGNN